MPENIYEVIALGARYWFIFLGALIVLRTFRWLRRDRKEKHEHLHMLQDAGLIGQLVWLQGEGDLLEEMVIPVPYEGVLGRNRTCDITVDDPAVSPEHCDFSFVSGAGVVLRPRRGCTVWVEGAEIATARQGKKHPLRPGAYLRLGDTILELQVYTGINAGAPVQRFQPIGYAINPAWPRPTAAQHQPPIQWQTSEQYPLYGQPTMIPQQPVYPPQYPPYSPQQPGHMENQDGWINMPLYGTQPQPPASGDEYPADPPARNRRARRRDDA